MILLIWFLRLFTPITRRLGVCGNVGFIAGALSGFILADMTWAFPALAYMSNQIAFANSIVLGLFAWVWVLFVLCVQAALTFRSVAIPSLFNCLVTCLLTVFISKWLNAYSFAWLIGMFVGASVGMILCRINFELRRR